MIQIKYEPHDYDEYTTLSLRPSLYLPIQILYEIMVSIIPTCGEQAIQKIIINDNRIITCYYQELGIYIDNYIHIVRDYGKTINIKKEE